MEQYTETILTKKKTAIVVHYNNEKQIVGKECTICHKPFPLQSFRKLKGGYLNLYNECRECCKKQDMAKRRAKGAKSPIPNMEIVEGILHRECTKCHLMKPLETDFDCCHSGFKGFHSCCRECKKRQGDLYRRNKGIREKREVPVVRSESGDVTHRECTRCLQMLPLTLFNKHKMAPFGVHPYCKYCSADRHLMLKHGITIKDKEQIFKIQNETCKICSLSLPIQKLHVDHCHLTGKIRGLLCHNCNLALGLLGDGSEKTIGICTKMIQYCANSISDRHSK